MEFGLLRRLRAGQVCKLPASRRLPVDLPSRRLAGLRLPVGSWTTPGCGSPAAASMKHSISVTTPLSLCRSSWKIAWNANGVYRILCAICALRRSAAPVGSRRGRFTVGNRRSAQASLASLSNHVSVYRIRPWNASAHAQASQGKWRRRSAGPACSSRCCGVEING